MTLGRRATTGQLPLETTKYRIPAFVLQPLKTLTLSQP